MTTALMLVDRARGFRPLYRLLICAVLGAFAALGQEPWGIWPATIVGLAASFGFFVIARSWAQAAWTGWAFGTGYFMLALSWIVEPFLVDVARHGWMAPFALLGLSGGLALFWGAAFAVARGCGGAAAAWIASFTLAEAARGYVLTGFPWAQPGHVWIDTPVLQSAGYTGSLGLTVILLLAAVSVWCIASGRWVSGGAGLALIAAVWGAGTVLPPAMQISKDAPVVRLIQPNAPQHEKWNPEKVQLFFDRQIEFTRTGARPDLIVWPETAVPVTLNRAGPTLNVIAEAAGGVPVVLGIRRFEGMRLFNSLVLLDESGAVDSIYDKHHLVPFGEYIPYGDQLGQFGIRGMAAGEGDGFSAGPGAQVIQLGQLGRALPLICYEGVFPQDVASAPGRADFMLLITNDAWFGAVSGPYQHLAQARLRSVEQGLPMIRVANTGVSAMIDPWGQIIAEIPLGEAGWSDAPLPSPRPPTVYAASGDLPLFALLLVVLGLSLIYDRKVRPRS